MPNRLLSFAMAGECPPQDAVGDGVEFHLKLRCGGAPGLLHQRRIEQHGDAIGERPIGHRRGFPFRYPRGTLLAELLV